MSRLRPLLLVLLIVSALPWGAYARVLHHDVPVALAASASQQGVAAFGKHCRIATLPGSPCASDQVILTDSDGLAVARARNPWPAVADKPALQHQPETPRAPPRSR